MTDEVMDPQELARSIAVETSERTDAVGDFVSSIELGNGVTDFRFVSNLVGYEGWQWSVTLYHDEETQRWTVNESTLVPTENSLLSPPWIPWKDRLKPSDLSVMDSIGTSEDDSRLEDGFRQVNNIDDNNSEKNIESTNSDDHSESKTEDDAKANTSEEDADTNANAEKDINQNQESCDANNDFDEDFEEAVSTLRLSRRRVMTAEAISQTAKRWYAGQHGPKSLSTKIADGKACSSCGFLIPLAGSLGSMFGVCANMWSPDDGRVVSLDHACGEHSDIEPPEPSQLWIQSEPAYDDYHIDILQQAPRDERADVELIEEAIEDSKMHRRKRRKLDSKLRNKKEASTDKDEQNNLSESDLIDNSTIDEKSYENNDDKNREIEVENQTEKIEETVANESEKFEKSQKDTDYPDSSEVNLVDENSVTEEIPLTGKVEESQESEDTSKTTASTSMRLYKRKSRRQHK